MSIRKKFDELDITWKIAIKKGFLVLACSLSSSIIGIGGLIVLSGIIFSLYSFLFSPTVLSVVAQFSLIFVFSVGIIKVQLDIYS